LDTPRTIFLRCMAETAGKRRVRRHTPSLARHLLIPAAKAGRKRHPLGVSQTRCRMKSLLSSARIASISKVIRVNQGVVLGGFICWCTSQVGACYADRPESDSSHGPVAATLQPRIQPRVVDHNPWRQVVALNASLAASATAGAQVDPRRAADFAHVVRSASLARNPVASLRPAKAVITPVKVEVSSLAPKRLEAVPPREIHHGTSPVAGTSVAIPAGPAMGIVFHGGLSSFASALTSSGSMDSLGTSVSLERATATPPALSPMTAPAFGSAAPLGSVR
jgi:hypothetical protein